MGQSPSPFPDVHAEMGIDLESDSHGLIVRPEYFPKGLDQTTTTRSAAPATCTPPSVGVTSKVPTGRSVWSARAVVPSGDDRLCAVEDAGVVLVRLGVVTAL